MIDDKKLLIEGERRLGRYTVVILRKNEMGRWTPSVMQLDATVTNYRLMLRPFRKKYKPASLPARYFTDVEMTTIERYHCVALPLITGDYLYLMLSTGKLEHLFEDLKAMTSPPPKFQFDDKVARGDIQRLITFFGREPLPGTTSP